MLQSLFQIREFEVRFNPQGLKDFSGRISGPKTESGRKRMFDDFKELGRSVNGPFLAFQENGSRDLFSESCFFPVTIKYSDQIFLRVKVDYFACAFA